MRTLDTDLIEKILKVNDIFLKFAQNNIFEWTWLTPTQFNILWEIIAWNWLLINDLKEKLIISAPALSQLLNRMEKAWFIERKLGKNDKREIKITPTDHAIETYNTINEKYIKIAWEKLATIKEKDKEIMIKFLDYIENTI